MTPAAPITVHLSGPLLADATERTITGLVLPYGSEGATSAGRVTAGRGSVEVAPEVFLNLQHDRNRPVGRMLSHAEDDTGITATFRVARTRAGDDLLAEVAEGLRTGLSVEVEAPVIRAGRLIGGVLSHVGAVVTPAFDLARVSAMTAADTPTDDGGAPAASTDEGAPPSTISLAPGESVTVQAEDPDTTETGEDAPVTETPEAPATAAAPATLAASAVSRRDGAPLTAADVPDVRTFAALIAANRHNRRVLDVLDAMGTSVDALSAELTDIPATGVDTGVPQYLGHLWSGQPYERRVVPLLDNRPLTGWQVKGWQFGTPPEVGPYAGDKAPIPSNAVTVEPVSEDVVRMAGGHDIDRKFVDFNDTDFLAAYLEALAQSYAIKTDTAAVDWLESVATVVTPGEVPTGISEGAAAIVDGALALLAANVNPTFAVVAPDAWRDILLTPQEKVLELLSQTFGLDGGEVAGFSIVPHGAMTAGTVVVGARQAAQFSELPGVPIRVSAIDVANGGVDEALFGYYATVLHHEAGLAKVTIAPVVP